ncbi:glutathione S-transferase [Salinisphaera sp. C84B14]|uniref:glutathione S-transferase family protein n=1 Tax=Salinisphaera sp. C84B14 TaxID=1304155 RepID=UPI003342A20E
MNAETDTVLKLYGRSTAFNVQKVLWLLDELELGFEHHLVGGRYGGLDDPAFIALNPHGKVPVLKDGDISIWESHAILRYLAAQYGDSRFWPLSPAERSVHDRWMDWSQTTLQPDFMRLFWRFYRMPEHKRDTEEIQRARRACERHYRLIDAELEQRRYLAGDRFSLADIPAGTTLYRYQKMGLDTALPARAAEWYANLCQRPAFQNRVMTPFSELRGRESF